MESTCATPAFENSVLRSFGMPPSPQAFKYGLLKEAFERARADGFMATDEALLAERIGVSVKLVTGSPYNIKITAREDLVLGELILSLRKAGANSGANERGK